MRFFGDRTDPFLMFTDGCAEWSLVVTFGFPEDKLRERRGRRMWRGHTDFELERNFSYARCLFANHARLRRMCWAGLVMGMAFRLITGSGLVSLAGTRSQRP